jgi:tripartite-type tricarboxylate transporter receptor subunit TctC
MTQVKIALLGAFAATALFTAPVLAQQDYPNREIHTVCGYVAGSGADVIVRYFSTKISELAGKPVIVENKPGALGQIAAEAGARARPDGYTMYMTAGSALASMPSMVKTVKVDPRRDYEMVTTLTKFSFILVVAPSYPAKNVAELTANLKKKPQHGLYGATAPSGLISSELYKSLAGLTTTQVNYRDAVAATNDLLGGSIDFSFMDPIAALQQIRAGKLRGLAVASAERLNAVPELPSMREEGVAGLNVLTWWGVMMPAGTPKPIVDKAAGWFNQVVQSEETKKFLNNIGADPFPGTPESAKKLMDTEVDAWREYIRLAKIEPVG